MKKARIVFIQCEASFCEACKKQQEMANFEIRIASSVEDGLANLGSAKPVLVVLEARAGTEQRALQLASDLKRQLPSAALALIVEKSSEDLAIKALRLGINEYFKKPVSFQEFNQAVKRLTGRSNDASNSNPPKRPFSAQLDALVGESASMRMVKRCVATVAPTDSTVFITGETGTGKGLVARLIHENSRRRRHAFVSVNSAAVPENLLESELFGHERGAFTGASNRSKGKFELADGGTLFLDEIGELSMHAQVKLLHALESQQIYRLGGTLPVKINVRIIAATNQNPEHLVQEDQFRKDLYYRLNVTRIHLPALRERREDIPLLIQYYLHEFNRRFGRQVERVSQEAQTFMLQYDWPGNVRELRNLIEACFIHLPNDRMATLELPEMYLQQFQEAASQSMAERDRILQALFDTNWNVSKAAEKLHWSRMTIYRKMARYQIVRPNGKM